MQITQDVQISIVQHLYFAISLAWAHQEMFDITAR